MLRSFHVIVSTYGFWLPNDPRGSWSDWVRRWELVQFGKATKVNTRDSVASAPHDGKSRRAAKRELKYPEVHLSGRQAQAVGHGFRETVIEAGYAAHACSILPQHVHLVLGPLARDVRRVIGHFKARATQQLSTDGLHPLSGFREADGTIPSPWARDGWVVFIFDEPHMLKAVEYVENNPVREGMPKQRWSFVTPYNSMTGNTRSKLRR